MLKETKLKIQAEINKKASEYKKKFEITNKIYDENGNVISIKLANDVILRYNHYEKYKCTIQNNFHNDIYCNGIVIDNVTYLIFIKNNNFWNNFNIEDFDVIKETPLPDKLIAYISRLIDSANSQTSAMEGLKKRNFDDK